MPKFRVYLTRTDTFSMTIEAEDQESALDEALEVASEEADLCAQDTGWGREWGVDASEWEEESVEELEE